MPVQSETPGFEAIELAIGGMTCASCAARVEKRLNRLDGVVATVNYTTKKAKVTFGASTTPDALVAEVEKAGYTAFHYRYDTALELQLLNELYPLVQLRLNMFTATTKAIDWRSNKHGKKTRVYDKPRTPYQRVLDSGVLTPERAAELAELFDNTNPADPTRQITAVQTASSLWPKTKPTLSPREFREQNHVRQAVNFREHLDMRHYARTKWNTAGSKARRSNLPATHRSNPNRSASHLQPIGGSRLRGRTTSADFTITVPPLAQGCIARIH